MVYVSITGMELISEAHAVKFWSYASVAMQDAKEAPGNIFACGAKMQETFHTLTIWEDRASMLHYMNSGSHAKAMKVFSEIASSGKIYGYETPHIKVPSWDELRRIYDCYGRPMVVSKAAEPTSSPRSSRSLDENGTALIAS